MASPKAEQKQHDRNTRLLRRRIAIVFDFDGTLAPDSYAALVDHCGLDPRTFEEERIKPLKEAGWEEILAKFYVLIQEARQRDDPATKITRERIAEFSRQLDPYPGVQDVLDGLRKQVRQEHPEVELEYYIVSSGIEDIFRHTPIADNFKAMWGCRFHYDEQGEIAFVSRIVSHVDKIRYLLLISQGLPDEQDPAPPEMVFRDIPPDEIAIPLDQIIYVGDGASDVPVFGLMNQHNGVAIGIYKPEAGAEGWATGSSVGGQERVSNLVPPDYGPDAEMTKSLTVAVEMICKRLELRELGAGE